MALASLTNRLFHIGSGRRPSYRRTNQLTESVDGRRGLIPAFTTFNLSANYTLSKQVKFFGTVRNLFDKKYIASRNPDGIFPGAERHVEVGMSYKF
ncbi:TonB-dependent receptor [Klebsiella pneumoniae]|nr:TonB-dependent receptor [Klebsiella pneumoniae]